MAEQDGIGNRTGADGEKIGVPVVREGSLVFRDKVYTVGELTAVVKAALATAFPQVWVAGEVSNARKYPSGHIYLTLKDADAQLSAVIWRSDAARLKFELKDGPVSYTHLTLPTILRV